MAARFQGSSCAAVLAVALLGCEAGAPDAPAPPGIAAPVEVPAAPLARTEDGAGGGGGGEGTGGEGTGGGSCQARTCADPSGPQITCQCGQICRLEPCPAECRVRITDTTEECTCLRVRCLDAPPNCNDDGDCRGDLGCLGGVCECRADGDCGKAGFRCSNGLCAPNRCQSSRDCCGADGQCLTCRADGVCGQPLAAGADPEFTCAQRAPARGRGILAGAAAALAIAAVALLRRARPPRRAR